MAEDFDVEAMLEAPYNNKNNVSSKHHNSSSNSHYNNDGSSSSRKHGGAMDEDKDFDRERDSSPGGHDAEASPVRVKQNGRRHSSRSRSGSRDYIEDRKHHKSKDRERERVKGRDDRAEYRGGRDKDRDRAIASVKENVSANAATDVGHRVNAVVRVVAQKIVAYAAVRRTSSVHVMEGDVVIADHVLNVVAVVQETIIGVAVVRRIVVP